MNSVQISGNLTRDPEYRPIADDNSVTKMRVAVEERKKEGEDWVSVPHYFDVTVFGKQGENCKKKLNKGSMVFVSGRLAYRERETTEGGKRNAVEIIANSVEGNDFFKPADQNNALEETPQNSEGTIESTPPAPAADDDDIPF